MTRSIASLRRAVRGLIHRPAHLRNDRPADCDAGPPAPAAHAMHALAAAAVLLAAIAPPPAAAAADAGSQAAGTAPAATTPAPTAPAADAPAPVLPATGAPAAATPAGAIEGTAWAHDAASLQAAVRRARVVVANPAGGAALFTGTLDELDAAPGPAGGVAAAQPTPVVVFLHGSSGLGLKAIGEWQQWLAGFGVSSLAPDSFALPGRVTYRSPIDRASYERIHALRAAEIAPAVQALAHRPWADPARLVLAGASEGAVPVARHDGAGFAARLVFSWSCEQNYFVDGPRNGFVATQPVLNVISATDPFFSARNPWLDAPAAHGHCGAALKDHPGSAVVLIPDAPHTLLMLPAARDAVRGFLAEVLTPPARRK